MEQVTRCQLPAEVDSIGRARSLVRAAAGWLPPRVLDDAELLVSELVTNAVQHGGPQIRLELTAGRSSLAVGVYDSGLGLPTMGAAHVSPNVPSGRGLRLVDLLAASWGVDREEEGGKVVWFRIAVDRPSALAPRIDPAGHEPSDGTTRPGDPSAKDPTAWS